MSTVRSIERAASDQKIILTIGADATAAQAAQLLGNHRVGVLVVVDDRQQVVGIVSERDIVAKVVGPCLDPRTAPVSQVMISQVVCCNMDTPVQQAQRLMARHRIRHLPIIEDGQCVGMVSSRDILLHELNQTRKIARRQCQVLNDLERQHPGITQLQRDAVGRVVV